MQPRQTHPSSNSRPAVERVPALNLPQRSLPAAPMTLESSGFMDSTGISLDRARIDESVPRLGVLMAEARASLEIEMPTPPNVTKLPREPERNSNVNLNRASWTSEGSSHNFDTAGGPPPSIPHLSQGSGMPNRTLSRSSSRRTLPPPLAPTMFADEQPVPAPLAQSANAYDPGANLYDGANMYDREPAFAASAAGNAAPRRPARSSPDHGSIFSRIDLDSQHAFSERGRTYGTERHLTRSLSMPADIRMPMPLFSPLALPVAPSFSYGYQMASMPMPMQSVPITMHGQVPVAMCNSCTSSWFPPPLPPVPCELKARLDALEQQVSSPHMESPPRLDRVVGALRQQLNEQKADADLSKELRAELWHAQDSERKTRDEMARRHQEVIAENTRLKEENQKLLRQQQVSSTESRSALSKDLLDLREAKMAEQRSREEAERRHKDVLEENRRLQGDHNKLLGDHAAEQRARADAMRKHEVVESDAQKLKHDLQRLQQAHNDELHSTNTNWQQRAQQDTEEATSSVLRDFERLQADREAEHEAYEELQRRYQAVLDDAERLRIDFQRAEGASDVEQEAREVMEQKHRVAELEKNQLQADLRHWQDSHGATQAEFDRTQTELHATKSEMERLRSQLSESEFQVQRLTAEHERTKTTHTKRSSMADQDHTNKEKLYEERITLLNGDVKDLREQLQLVESSKFQLQGDFQHLERAKNQREEAEKSLRKSLQEEQKAARELQAKVTEMQDEKRAAETAFDLERNNADLLRRRLEVLQSDRDALQARFNLLESGAKERHSTSSLQYSMRGSLLSNPRAAGSLSMAPPTEVTTSQAGESKASRQRASSLTTHGPQRIQVSISDDSDSGSEGAKIQVDLTDDAEEINGGPPLGGPSRSSFGKMPDFSYTSGTSRGSTGRISDAGRMPGLPEAVPARGSFGRTPDGGNIHQTAVFGSGGARSSLRGSLRDSLQGSLRGSLRATE